MASNNQDEFQDFAGIVRTSGNPVFRNYVACEQTQQDNLYFNVI